MTKNPHSNMDARDLWELAQRVREEMSRLAHIGGGASGTIRVSAEDAAMLIRAAQHLQSMDEKLSRHIDSDYAGGRVAERELARGRSNFDKGRKITDEDGHLIIAALADPDKVRRIPVGLKSPPKPGKPQEIDPKKSVPARTGFRLGDL